jgi:SAM-dependent methyltransferase
MDISEGCISRAAQMYPALEFRVADVEKTGLADSSVDVICYFGLLHHFPDFNKVAAEAYRVLKPGGRFFSFDPHHYNPAFWLYRAHESPFYSPIGVTPNERLMTKGEVKKVFSQNGFETGGRVMSGIRFTYVESPRARKLLPLYNFLDGILAWTPLASLIGAWVVGWGRKKAS